MGRQKQKQTKNTLQFLDAMDTLLKCPVTKKRFTKPVILITDNQDDEVTLEELVAKKLIAKNQAIGYRRNLLVEQILDLMNDTKTPWHKRKTTLIKLFECPISYELFNKPTLLIHNNPEQSAITLEEYWANSVQNNTTHFSTFSAATVIKFQKNELINKIIKAYLHYFPQEKLTPFEYTEERGKIANAQNPIARNQNIIQIEPLNIFSFEFKIIAGIAILFLITFNLFNCYRRSLVNKPTEVVCENEVYDGNHVTMECYTRPMERDIRFFLRCISSFSDACAALYQKTSQERFPPKIVPIHLTETCHASFFARCLERPYWKYTGPQFENNTEGLEYQNYDTDRKYSSP